MIRIAGTAALNGSWLCILLAAVGLTGCGVNGGEQATGTTNAALKPNDKANAHSNKVCDATQPLKGECKVPGTCNANSRTTLAVYGDAPYGTTPTDTTETLKTPAFIDAVNADASINLVLHVGDIHSGKQYCTQPYDQTIHDLWAAYKQPLVYTPGDNEWTDCNKIGEGGGLYNTTTHNIDYVVDSSGNLADYAEGDPIANLELIRSIFFANPGLALGGEHKKLLTQALVFDPAYPSDANYVENVMWEDSRVLFVTINLPGGSNDDTDVWYAAPVANITAAQVQERIERDGADLRWLDLAFAQANSLGAVAVVIGTQADMWDPANGAAHQANYEPFVKSIANHTTAFGKPVLMFNGDSHVYQSSNPLSATDSLAYMHPADASLPRYDVPNFHRIVVHGSTLPLEYLRLTVDPKVNAPVSDTTFGPFSWERVIPAI